MRIIHTGTLSARRTRGFFLFLLIQALLVSSCFSGEKIDFNTRIRPLLSDRCYACHGPDANSRKAGLRLDLQEALVHVTDKGKRLIQPGQPEASLLYQRITHSDPDEVMPPVDSKLSLSPQEKTWIREWIEQGAEWERHWSFNPVQPVQPPELANSDWAANPIDIFVLKKLREIGLEPSTEAEKERLIRRVSLDLTGLPPTLEEVDAFLKDTSEQAYEQVVDRLLQTQAFGERMALDWLDASRFADTHGYQADRYRPMWPWRDWVIEAFNSNMPYDQFIRWQMAGDLIPDASKEQILATAFNRHHRQTEEGGSVPEEFRVAYVADRLHTMGTAMLGLTLECARCHSHKYDPISQKDYYSLFAFFNNIDESGQTSHFTDSIPVPTLMLTDKEQDKKIQILKEQIRLKESASTIIESHAQEAFNTWKKDLPVEPEIQGEIAHFPLDILDGQKTPNLIEPEKPGVTIETPVLTTGRIDNAVLLDGENGIEFRDIGRFSRIDPFSISVWIQLTQPLDRAVVVHCSKAPLDAANRGYEITIEEGRLTAWLTHMWPNNALKIASTKPLPIGEWVHILMTYDGSSQAKGLKLFVNGALEKTDVIRDNLYKDILYKRVAVHLTIGQRFRDNGFKGGKVDDLRVYNRELGAIESKTLFSQVSSNTNTQSPSGWALEKLNEREWFDYFLRHHSPSWASHLEELKVLRARLSQIIEPIPEIMVMKEMSQPRPTYVLERGAYDAHGEEVKPSTPSGIMEFSDDLPRDRLGLANWLVDKANPLTSRVAVNRYWQMFFGRGLVDTPEDFGSQGSLPSHPELLDWLAWSFMDSAWDVKGLIKKIVMSSTYKQSTRYSESSRDSRELDPDNRFLSRGPGFRLPAELIRDQALAVSGLLVREVGGPSVKPYQPPGLWEEKSGSAYQMDKGKGQYRRSLYTFWKRTSPPPSMTLFDAPDRETCTVNRQRTNTPLQALVLLNDPQFVQAAIHLAHRISQAHKASDESLITPIFRSVLARSPSKSEIAVLEQLFHEQKAEFESVQGSATAFLEEFNTEIASDNNEELAALGIVAMAVLNHEEAIVRR